MGKLWIEHVSRFNKYNIIITPFSFNKHSADRSGHFRHRIIYFILFFIFVHIQQIYKTFTYFCSFHSKILVSLLVIINFLIAFSKHSSLHHFINKLLAKLPILMIYIPKSSVHENCSFNYITNTPSFPQYGTMEIVCKESKLKSSMNFRPSSWFSKTLNSVDGAILDER